MRRRTDDQREGGREEDLTSLLLYQTVKKLTLYSACFPIFVYVDFIEVLHHDQIRAKTGVSPMITEGCLITSPLMRNRMHFSVSFAHAVRPPTTTTNHILVSREKDVPHNVLFFFLRLSLGGSFAEKTLPPLPLVLLGFSRIFQQNFSVFWGVRGVLFRLVFSFLNQPICLTGC